MGEYKMPQSCCFQEFCGLLASVCIGEDVQSEVAVSLLLFLLEIKPQFSHEKTLEKSKLRDILQQNSSIFFKRYQGHER
jgi:hypothetical protein